MLSALMYTENIKQLVEIAKRYDDLNVFIRESMNNRTLLRQLKQETNFLPNAATARERLWYVEHNTNTPPTCKICSASARWNNGTRQFQKYCSVKCANQDSDVLEARAATNILKYGHASPTQNQEIREKQKQTMLTRYGVPYGGMSTAVQLKREKTCSKRYGALNPFQNQRIREKQKQTVLERYGVENIAHLPETQAKKEQTCLEKYGVKNIFCDGEFRNKIQASFIEKHGVNHPAYLHISQESLEKLSDVNWLHHQHINEGKSLTEIGNILGVQTACISSYFKKYSIPVSSYNIPATQQEIVIFLKELSNYEMLINVRTVIPPYELDIYFPEHKLAIEYNGVYWHSELSGRDKKYHLHKTMLCVDKNVRLVHIFSSEWIHKQKIVKSRLCAILGKNNKFFARKCVVEEVNSGAARSFLENNHIQGYTRSKINLGLIHDGELVALMTFGKSRFNSAIEWEMLRFCSSINTTVIGGASKLFQFFTKQYHPQSVISYSDRRWNTGKLYEQLGFKHTGTTNPNYFYFQTNIPSILYSRIQFQKHKLPQHLKVFDPALTEWENMVNNGYDRIWDCGNDVFIWNII